MIDVINSKFGRFLLAIPIIIGALAAAYFMSVTVEIEHALLEEKYYEKRLELDLIDNLVDQLIIRDDDWDNYNYQALLNDSIELLDAQPFTFAALYDEKLINLSHRTASYEDLYNPFLDDGFKSVVLENESGNYISSYTPKDQPVRDMLIYWRWVPTDKGLSNRFLTVVAISKYSVTTHAAEWVGVGAFALVVIITLLNVAIVALLLVLGNIYGQREGVDKWREELKR